jgi:HEPN domain-containing protein
MTLDKLALKRFEELEQRAKVIAENDREFDFQSVEGKNYYNIKYASFQGWATNALNLLQRVFGEDSIHYQHLNDHYKSWSGSESSFEACRAIFQAAREDYEGGYIFKLRGLIQAEVFDNMLEQATELLNAGYKDPACVVAGVALETTLKELCEQNSIPHAKVDKMNADLCKAGIYNMAMQKQVTAWAERRNKSAHGDPSASSKADVEEMIRGVERVIAEYL